LRNSWEFYHKKILRISPDYFSENSWEILRTWSLCLQIFIPRNSWEILLNASPEIPEKFLGFGDQVIGFLGELNKRISFWKYLRMFKFCFSPIGVSEVIFYYALLLLNLFFFSSLLIKNDNLQTMFLKKLL